MDATVNFGLLTLVPPLVVIVFALVTKKTFEALILGAVIGFLMTDNLGFLSALISGLQDVLAGDIWLFLCFGVLGSFVFLLQKSQGTLGFSKFVQKYANAPKRSLIISWILGIIIFMDDYLNILTISTSMRDVTDKQKTPREMLAYVIDSTGAPVCVLIPLSTWAVFYAGVIGDQSGMASYGTGMDMYMSALPFILYGWTAILVVPLVILGVIPKIFGMKKSYERVRTTGRVYSENSDKFNLQVGGVEENNLSVGKIYNFLIPIIIVVIVTIYTGDLLLGLVFAIIAMLILYLPTKLMSFTDFSESFANGFASMVPMIFITAGALLVKTSMDGIGLPQYVINAVLPYMNVSLFPAITFLVVASLSFITGSNWGIPALTVPILIPLALAGGADPIITFGAIISGGTFGSHACFYSDATVLTSQACGIENLEHAFTQLPYAVISALLALIGFLICGFAF